MSGWPADDALADAMDLTRDVCSAALSLRKARQLRVRLPLASLTVAHPAAAALAEFADVIKDEVNVKDLVLSDDPATLGEFQLTVSPRVLGPRLGQQVQQVIRAVKAGDWTQDGDIVTAAGAELKPGEYELKLAAADPDSTTALPGSGGLIALDITVTPELAAEGTARDVVRVVQQARKDAGLDVSDRIALVVGADGRDGGRGAGPRGVRGRGNAGHRAHRRARGGGQRAGPAGRRRRRGPGDGDEGLGRTAASAGGLGAVRLQRQGLAGALARQRAREPAEDAGPAHGQRELAPAGSRLDLVDPGRVDTGRAGRPS